MSTATAPLAAGFTLTGTTVGIETAPIWYTISGSGFGAAIGQQFTAAQLSNIRVQYIAQDDKTELYIDGYLLGRYTPSSGQVSSIIDSLKQATTTINTSITTKATTASPAPKPAPAPTTVAKPTTTAAPTTTAKPAGNVTVATTSSNIKVSTSTSANTANVNISPAANTIVVNKTPITVAGVKGAANVNISPAANTIVVNSKPPTPKGQTGPLPLGDQIDDIYDPNLTPEQVASLNPGDQAARAAYLKDSSPYTGPTNEIVVIAPKGLTGAAAKAKSAATEQDQAQFLAKEDWRVRLSLAPGSNYLYNDPDGDTILQPLKDTDGVIFPYTPAITVNYAANYEGTNLPHTNYKIYQYQNSSVDQVQITCEFTCQDVKEANYLLAVIHFFRSMTKMFYGQDSMPKNGTPPPLCYIFGMGGYQFDALPLAISGFNYALPPDVDYIKTLGASAAGTPQPSVQNGATDPGRLGGQAAPGGLPTPPSYGTTPTQSGESATWVPTKIQLSITCLPVLSRNQVSNYFSLKEYATGKLVQGTKRQGGGFW